MILADSYFSFQSLVASPLEERIYCQYILKGNGCGCTWRPAAGGIRYSCMGAYPLECGTALTVYLPANHLLAPVGHVSLVHVP